MRFDWIAVKCVNKQSVEINSIKRGRDRKCLENSSIRFQLRLLVQLESKSINQRAESHVGPIDDNKSTAKLSPLEDAAFYVKKGFNELWICDKNNFYDFPYIRGVSVRHGSLPCVS